MSNGAASSFGERPVAAQAFQMRAPSRCTARPRARARSAIGDRVALREDASAGAVVGVLDADEARARRPVGGRLDALFHRVGVEEPARAGDRELHAGERGAGAALVEDDVRALADDHLVAGARVQRDGELVAHRAGRHEERRLLADERGDLLLERANARVLAEDVVADLGARHDLAHGGSRARDGVGAEIDHDGGEANKAGARPSTSASPFSAGRDPSTLRTHGAKPLAHRRAPC